VGKRFCAPVQTGPGAHSASYATVTGSFPGVKRPKRGVDHPSPSSAEVKERVELYLCCPSGPSWPVPGWPLPLPLSVTIQTILNPPNTTYVCFHCALHVCYIIRPLCHAIIRHVNTKRYNEIRELEL